MVGWTEAQREQMPQYVKSLRIALGLTQEQFASRLGISFTTVSRWETGIHRPTRYYLKVLRNVERTLHLNPLRQP